jgi:Predicted small integral membrane protein (DUF2165)
MVLLLFAGGFIAIGGEWFVMWQSSDWNGLDPALQNVIIAGVALILAHLPTREWGVPGPAVTRPPPRSAPKSSRHDLAGPRPPQAAGGLPGGGEPADPDRLEPFLPHQR